MNAIEQLKASGLGAYAVGVSQEWIDSELVFDPSARTPSGAMYEAYVTWCERRGARPCSHITFTRQLVKLGAVLRRSARSRHFLGLRVQYSETLR